VLRANGEGIDNLKNFSVHAELVEAFLRVFQQNLITEHHLASHPDPPKIFLIL
jgi:hypothetical protein